MSRVQLLGRTTLVAKPRVSSTRIVIHVTSNSHHFVAVGSCPLVGVVVVVPAFAVGPKADEPVVAAVVVGFVVAVAPDVGERVDAPGNVPSEHGSHQHAPDKQARTKLGCRGHRATHRQLDAEPAEKENSHRRQVNQQPVFVAF